jgi:hypothetical protein
MIPVFILGVSPRSGTNYLYELLTLHPDCVKSRHNGEDFIIYNAPKYLDFLRSVTGKWAPEWKNDPQVFRKCLESGILSYVSPESASGRYVIMKTPHPNHAERFFEMFSNGYLVLLVRCGQDIAESFSKSFNYRFDDAVRAFSYGAREIASLTGNDQLMKSGRVTLIRYEDLFTRNRETMSALLDFLKLDPNRFDFDKSENFDVIGSSQHKEKQGKVQWDPVKKNTSFNPLKRYAGWSRWKHYRFNWMAGASSRKFGYPLEFEGDTVLYYLFNILVVPYDFIYRILRKLTGGRKAGWLK